MKKCIFLALTASAAHGQVESGAPCSNTMPSNDACCYEDKNTPVMGGVDFVDLANKKQGQDGAVFGSSDHKKTLSGYAFHFLSAANAETFAKDPWKYAPAWGGF